MERAEKLIKINRSFINRCLAYYNMTEEELRQEAITTYYLHPEIDKLMMENKIRKASSLYMACLRRNASSNMPFGVAIRDNRSWDNYNNTMNIVENSYSGIEEDDIEERLWKDEFRNKIKEFIGEEDYIYLIEYYEYGSNYIADKYLISNVNARTKTYRLITKIRNKFL